MNGSALLNASLLSNAGDRTEPGSRMDAAMVLAEETSPNWHQAGVCRGRLRSLYSHGLQVQQKGERSRVSFLTNCKKRPDMRILGIKNKNYTYIYLYIWYQTLSPATR